MEKNYFGSIEFGSIYTTCVVVSYFQNKIDVVASCKVLTEGYYDGEVKDHDAFLSTIDKVISEISSKYRINLDEVVLVLPNNNHKIYSAYVSNKVLTERQIIGKQQVDAIRNQIKSAKVNDGEVLVDEVPTLFTLDGERVLRSAPINYQSSVLAIKSNVHTLPKIIVDNLKSALSECGINTIGQTINCYCGALASTSEYDLENECIHINIGQEVTTISAYSKSLLIKSLTINFGIETLISHLAYTLKIDKEYATNLFESYFISNVDYASDVIFDEENNLSEKRISGIVLNKVYNGFNQILDECVKLAEDCKFSDQHYYLLTGWLNDYEYFVEEFAKYSTIKIKEGKINVIGLSSQAFINCYGALLSFFNSNKELVEKRVENDDSIDLNNYNKSKNENKESTESKSRFKDIFDD